MCDKKSAQHLFDIANTICSRHVEYRAYEKGSSYGIDVAWYQPDGKRSRGLNTIEKTFAYGCKVSTSKKTKKTNLSIVALKSRKIEIKKNDKGELKAYAMINGKETVLTHIWVEATRNKIHFPKVHYIDAYGIDLNTGKEVTERINK